MNSKRFRRFGAGVIGSVAVVAAVLQAAPAEANVTSLTTTNAYYVGSTYSLTATCDFTSSMAFTDNGDVIRASVNGVDSQTFWPDANGVVQIPWVPSSACSHTIVAQGCASATQSDAPVQIVLNVINKP